jgi:Na+/H+ antiporter NhaB
LHGNIVAVVALPFLALVLVLSVSVFVAAAFYDIYKRYICSDEKLEEMGIDKDLMRATEHGAQENLESPESQ